MELPPLSKGQKRVLIVGAGFAGIRLAKKLSARHFQVILLDKNNYHQFQPLLYQVATSGLEPSSISFPLRKIFQSYAQVFMRITEVLSVDAGRKEVNTKAGTIPYDYLVLAYGATTNFFGNTNLQQHAFPMKSVAEALLLRNTLLRQLEEALSVSSDEERMALLNVVVVGGGPTGVELAGALAEMKNTILPRDYTELNFKLMRIILLEASPKLLGAMSEASGEKVVGYLEQMGVEVMTGKAVKDFDGKTVYLNDGSIIRSKCLIWAAGVKGFSLPGIPAKALGASERILVNSFNEVAEMPDVFALGDIALMPSDDYPRGHPQVAPVAIQQATLLAKNLEKKLEGKPMDPFVYHNQGSMATVGKNKAVVEIGKLKLGGFFAWFTWMAVHLMSIVGVKNRIFVFLNWVWHYFTHDPSLRLMIKPSERKIK
jgi:NADH:ubiquinone reductase (H+-translocating)